MNKYIIELLKTESTVIIPEFGALMGAGNSLMFNPILKFNDGKLIKYIAKKEGKDEQEVANMVAKHVKEINLVLDKGESYEIFGLGSFSKGGDGKVVFQVSDSAEPINTEEKPAKEEPKKETPIVTPVVEKKEAPKVEEKKEEPKKEEKPTPVVATDKKEEKKPEKKVEAKTKKENRKPEKPKKEKKKKKGWIIWLVILLIVFGGGGTFVALKWKEVNAWISSLTSGKDKNISDVVDLDKINNNTDEHQTDEETMLMTPDSLAQTEGDTLMNELDSAEINSLPEKDVTKNVEAEEEEEIIEDIVEEKEEPKEEVIKSEPVVVSNDLKYHIMVGAFSDRSNAEGLVKKMQDAGLSNARILPGGGLAKVVAGSYATKADASAQLSKAREFNDGAYVMKK